MSLNILKNRVFTSLKNPLDRVSDYSNITELYKGVAHTYILFWDDNKPVLREFISGNGHNEHKSIEAKSGKNLLKDHAQVYVSGPQVYQRLIRLDGFEKDISEWIIANRHKIWPKGIDDESLDFSYTILNTSKDKFIYIVFILNDTLDSIYSFCDQNKLIPVFIIPRACLLFSNKSQFNADSLKGNSLIRGKVKEKIIGDNGYCRIVPESNLNDEENIIPQIINGDSKSEVSSYLDFNNSIVKDLNLSIQSVNSFRKSTISRIFKSCIYVFLSLLILFITLNIYLSVQESRNSGVLTEIEILESNTNQLEKNILEIENELTKYANLFSGHTQHGIILSEISGIKPKDLWFRYIEVRNNSQKDLSIAVKGYTVDKGVISEYVTSLESLDRIRTASITSMSRITENVPVDIPSRFHDKLFRYSINIEVSK